MADNRDTWLRVGALAGAAFMATCHGGGDPGEKTGEKTGEGVSAVSSAGLLLQELNNSCGTNQAQKFFQVKNNGSTSVTTSDVTIKFWVDDVSAAQIQAAVYTGGCLTNASGCFHQVSGVSASVRQLSPGCGPAPNSQANWEVTISNTDHTALAPGVLWTNLQAALHLSNYGNFNPGTADWYSGCLAGSGYVNTPHSAVYVQGQLVTASPGIPPSCVASHGSQVVPGATAPGIAAGTVPLVGPLPGSTTLSLAISLPLQNTAALQTLIQELYDPTSNQFGQYLTPAQFGAQFGTNPTDYQHLVTYLTTAGLTVARTYANNSHITVTGTAAAIESALNVTLNQYQRPNGSVFYSSANDPSLNIGVPIAYIAGLDNYAVPVANSGMGDPYTGCPVDTGNAGNGYLGDDFKNIYLGQGVTQNGGGMVAAVVAFDGLYAADYTNYANKVNTVFRPLAPILPSVTEVPVQGVAVTPAGQEKEVAMAVEMLYAVAPAAQIRVYEYPATSGSGADSYTGSTSAFEAIMNRIADDHTANVIVNPWTWRSTGATVDTGVASVMLQAAAEGISFFQAAGDAGPYLDKSSDNGFCSLSILTLCSSSTPCAAGLGTCTYPGVPEPIILSPLMTVVGGTTLPSSAATEGRNSASACSVNGDCASNFCNTSGPLAGTCDPGEAGWKNGPAGVGLPPDKATGGGYAVGYTGDLGLAYAPQNLPFYQVAASKSLDTFMGGTNTVRLIPDVSIVADQMTMFVANSGTSTACPGGTSAASALWGGIALLIDQQAKALGHPTLGFANPALYLKATAGATNFNDVGLHGSPTVSTNPNFFSFQTQVGYDLVSGLGSPNAGLITAGGILPSQSCQAGTNLTLLVNPQTKDVIAYAPNGSWSEDVDGVRYIPLENNPVNGSLGGSGTVTYAAGTVDAVNTCSGDSGSTTAVAGSGNVVCTGNDQSIYLINGTAVQHVLTNTFATNTQGFSGTDDDDECFNCNVAIDPQTHLAYVSMGIASGAAFEVIDINKAFSNPADPTVFVSTIPLNVPSASEAIQVDTTRSLILSPNEQGNYQLASYQVANPSTTGVYDFQLTASPSLQSQWLDSAAEDCSTGIAIAPVEFGTGGFGFGTQVVLVDLTLARFNPGSGGNGTWAPGRCSGQPLGVPVGCVTTADCTAASAGTCDPFFGVGFASLPEMATSGFGVQGGSAVASDGSHLGFIATEFGGPGFAVIKLPATTGLGHPALQQYVVASLPNTPATNTPWQMGLDPHTIGLYTSPNNGRVYGVFQNDPFGGPRDFLAIVDLQAILDLGTAGSTNQIAAGGLSTCCQQSYAGCAAPSASCIVRFVNN